MNPYTQIIRNATTGHATKASDRNFAHSAPPPLLLCLGLLFTEYNYLDMNGYYVESRRGTSKAGGPREGRWRFDAFS